MADNNPIRHGRQVSDDYALLDALVADSASAPDMYRPTPYWQGYADRIVDELRRAGMRDFRQNQTVLKGFGSGGNPRPALPQAAWKRAIWSSLARAPGVSQIVGEYERVLRAVGQHLRQTQIKFARQILPQIEASFPALRIPDGVATGSPDDAFEWKGQLVTADWVMYLARAADFYSRVPPAEVKAILEIGPGLGLSSLAHIALNGNLRTIVNVDIVPVIYVSTRFLASSSSVKVVDYSAVRGSERIDLSTSETPTIWSLPAWMLTRVQGTIDYAFNAYSFEEMEEEVCASYAAQIMRLTSDGVQLYGTISGHKAGAGGQRKPVTRVFLRECFAPKFPSAVTLEGFWTGAYDGKVEEAVLLRH